MSLKAVASKGGGGGGGVTSIDGITGAITLVEGSGITIQDNTPSAGDITISATSGGGGTVTSASVVSANGFAGTVANATTTPAITLSTSITGVLLGNGTAISASNVTNDVQTKAAIVPNTTPSAGQLLVGNAGGTAYAPVSSSGDVTIASTGATTIGNNKVTYAKMQQASTVTLLGNPTGGTANLEEITLGTNLSFSGSVLNATGGGSSAFNAITSGTNTTAAMVVGSGASLAATGTGAITATAATALSNLNTDGIVATSSGNGTLFVASTTGAGNVVLATSPTLVSPALGTPTALIGTNITGTASGLTAGNVTTNANLTGPITSVGNAVSTLTAHAVLLGEGTSAIGYATIGTSGRVLIDQGASADPSFNAVSGDIAITNTGATTIQTNAVTTSKINAAAVTYAKIQNEAAVSLLGNPTGSPASPSEITLGSGLAFSGTTLTATGSGGTVTTVSVVSANGFAGTVANATTTPAITISTSITGIVKGNGTAISTAVSGTDYSAGTSALSTGILKSTTSTGALTIAVAADFPTLNQNTSGNAATVTTNANLTGPVTSVGNATTITANAVTTTTINANAVTNAKMATSTVNTLAGYDGSGNFSDVTVGTGLSLSSGTLTATGGGSGTVTSVTFTGDGTVLSSTPSSAVTTSGTVTGTLLTQTANKVLAGPTTGSAANPTFRSLVGADLPNPSSSTLGGIESLAAVTSKWINTISTSGVPSATQPAFTDITGVVTLAQGGFGTALSPSGSNLLYGYDTTDGVSALITIGSGLTYTHSTHTLSASGGGSSAFSSLTSGTNTTAAMVVGTGGSLATSGSGTIAATSAPASGISGTLGVSNGGTGDNTLTAHSVLLGNGTSAVAFATTGTGGAVLLDQGSGNNPAFTVLGGDVTIPSGSGGAVVSSVNGGSPITISTSFQTTGGSGIVLNAVGSTNLTLPTSGTVTAQGNTITGTGSIVLATSPTLVTPALGTPSSGVATNLTGTASGLTSGITNALASASTTVNVSSATAPTSGQVLTATSGSAATWQTPGGGGGYSPIPTTVVTGTTQAMSTNNAYASNNAAQVVFTLPSTFAVGDEMMVMGLGAGGWSIAQNASQLIHFGNQVTTTGTGGSISSGTQYDTIHLKVLVANTTLTVISSQGGLVGI